MKRSVNDAVLYVLNRMHAHLNKANTSIWLQCTPDRCPSKLKLGVLSQRFCFLCGTADCQKSTQECTPIGNFADSGLIGLINYDDDSHDPLLAILWTGVTRTTSSPVKLWAK